MRVPPGDGEARPGSHVGTGSEKAPEMPGIFLEPLGPERQRSGLDAATLKEIPMSSPQPTGVSSSSGRMAAGPIKPFAGNYMT